MLLTLDRQTQLVVDSMQTGQVTELSDWSIRTNGKKVKDYDFIFKTASASDTVKNISYTEQTVIINCNECFLAQDKQEMKVYKDFSYGYKNNTFTADTLFITN